MPMKKTMRKRPVKKTMRRKRRHTGTTTMVYTLGKSLHQPFPDRYFTWLTQEGSGYFANGAAFFTQAFSISSLYQPFNNSATIGPFPNMLPAIGSSAAQATGFYNLIGQNGANGLYSRHRVWGVKVTLSFIPETLSDSLYVVMAPFNTSLNGSYPNTVAGIITAAQAPGSVTRDIVYTDGYKGRHMTKYYKLYELLGIPKKDYAGQPSYSPDTGTAFQYNETGSQFIFVGVKTLDQTNTGAQILYKVHLEWLVEFFQRCDTALLP